MAQSEMERRVPYASLKSLYVLFRTSIAQAPENPPCRLLPPLWEAILKGGAPTFGVPALAARSLLPRSWISNPSVCSTVPEDVDLLHFSSVIRRVLAESPLEELEILQPITAEIRLALSRQLRLKRLAIDASLLDSIPVLVDLDDLAVTNVEESCVELIERFSQVSRLTLVGDYHAISDVDGAKFPKLKDINVGVTSSSARREPRGMKLSMSSLATVTTLTFAPNDTWTNTTFNSTLCSAYTTNITSLTVQVDAAATLWFRLPACVSTWSTLNVLFCANCQIPNMTLLPTSMTNINIQGVRGSWTQREAGTSTAIYGDYFDWNWMTRLPNLSVMLINGVNGTLPNHLSHTKLVQLYLSQYFTTAKQHIVGTIAPDFFARYPALTIFELHFNKMVGTIPNYGMEKITRLKFGNNGFTHWPPLLLNGSTTTHALSLLELYDNDLVQIPSDASFAQMPGLTLINFARNSNLSTSFPNVFNTALTRTASKLVATIIASGCNFTGTLPAIPASQVSLYNTYSNTSYAWSFDGNSLSGTIPSSWSGLSLSLLNLSSNAGLNGTLAQLASNGSIVSQFIKTAGTLLLDGTGFSGIMFNLTSMTTLQSVTVETPNIDFCSTARKLPSSSRPLLFPNSVTTYCELSTTNASYCPWAYPSVCRIDAAPPSSGCALPSPGPSFVCEGSVWVAPGSVVQPIITIPPGTTVFINGNLTTSSIVITSVGSTISVTGCVSSADGTSPNVTIVLTEADLEKITQGGGNLSTQLILQAAGCTAMDPSSLTVSANTNDSCKGIKADNIDTSTGLAATFTITHSCNSKSSKWWIIVVSVVCGLVFLGLLIFAIVFSVCQSRRRKAEHAKLQDREARG